MTLLTLIIVSYASFPIADTLQTEEIKQYHYSLQKLGVDVNSCKCESCRSGIDPLLSKPKPLPTKFKTINDVERRKPNGNRYALLSILFALGAIMCAFLTLGSGLMHNVEPSTIIIYLLLTILSIVGTFFSAIQAKKSGASWSKALLGVVIVLLLASLLLIGV